nr:protein vascular associated death 1, chloroplastic [Tanacetum cinerariifolium]
MSCSPMEIRNMSPNRVFGKEFYGNDLKGFGVNPSINQFTLCNSDEWMSGNHGGIARICGYGGDAMVKVIPFDEITSVKRAKTAGIFPTAIELVAADKKYFFTSFLSRDEAIKLIEDGWEEHGNGSKAMSDQQDLRSELIDEEPEIVDAEDSDEVIPPGDEPETRLRNTGDATPKQFNRSHNIETEVSVTPSSVQDAVDEDTAVVENTDCSSSRKALPWEVEDADAPDVPDGFTLAAESAFPIKVDEFFSLFFSDDALPFLESYHKKCGDKDLKCTTWKPHDQLGYAREVSFQHPIKIYFGARFGSCNEVQNFRVYKNSHLVVKTSQEINDVPYGDYFRVEGLWDVVADSNGGCTLKVYVNVAFSKKTMWKGKIVAATVEECRDTFATFIEIAEDLLKQKSVDKEANSIPVVNVEAQDNGARIFDWSHHCCIISRSYGSKTIFVFQVSEPGPGICCNPAGLCCRSDADKHRRAVTQAANSPRNPSKPNLNFRAVHKSYSSIFFSNIPWKATVQDFWDSCNQWGVVIDVYIAAKRSKSGHRFGFVRFKNINDINKLVSNLRVTWMGEFYLFADVAKYGRTNNKLEEQSGDSKPNEGMNTQLVRDNANVFQSFNSYAKAVLSNKSVGVSGNNDASEILEDHFDGDRRNDTIEDNADISPSTNVYLDVNQNTSIPEVVEDLSSLDRSSDKAERLSHHNNGLDDLDISLRNRLLHQDKCRVRPVKAAVNDSSILSPSTPPGTVLNLDEESRSTWLDYVGPLITDELDSEKRWSYRDPDGNVQGSFSLAQLRMWKDYFPSDIKIWSYYGNVKETILLHSALKRRTKDAG